MAAAPVQFLLAFSPSKIIAELWLCYCWRECSLSAGRHVSAESISNPNLLYAIIKVCFSILSYSIFEKKTYYTKIFLNYKNYQLQPPLQKTDGELQTSTAPPVWTMEWQFLSDVVSHVSLRWSGAGHYQAWSYPTLETQQLWAVTPLGQLCAQWHHCCRESPRNQPGTCLWQGQRLHCAPAKLKKLMMPNPCFYSGYIYEFFSATCGCSCSNDYYRNVKFLHTKNTDWRIPLFSNKHGFGLAEDFIKLQFTLPFALK